jgi:hypothetical protein
MGGYKMLLLPETKALVQSVRDALDVVTAKHLSTPISNPAWFPTIARKIAERLKLQQPGLECYYTKGLPPVCDGGEWNRLDFLALSRDALLAPEDRLPMQAVVVGEVEISSIQWDAIIYDFEKVLIVDSLMFFMVIMQYSPEDADENLNRLERAARCRQDYARMRGNTPPAFLLSCWVNDAHPPHFEHRSG